MTYVGCADRIICHQSSPQWGTADAEIKDLSVQNSELKVSLLRLGAWKPGVGQNTAMHASPTPRHFFLELVSTLPVHSPTILSKASPEFFLC